MPATPRPPTGKTPAPAPVAATPPADDAGGGARALYSFAEVAKILGLPEGKLRYWAQTGFVGPSVKRGGRQLFSFQDLVGVKAAKELTERGVKPAQIRRALDSVRDTLPHVDRPLDRLRLAFDGEALVIVDDGAAF
jgi:DNA-binding transcriptional MerR regulator